MITSQVMLINKSKLETWANHASVTHVVYDLTFFHVYKIVNVIQVYTMRTITMCDVLRLNTVSKPSSISEDAVEIQINSQPYKGNNMTTQHTTAARANE
jgi:hypothetical protein